MGHLLPLIEWPLPLKPDNENFSDKERAVIIERLKLARSYLWDGADLQTLSNKTRFLCVASMWPATHAGEESKLVERFLIGRMGPRDQNKPYASLSSWLSDQMKLDELKLPAEDLQKHRKKWLEELISELEAAPSTSPT